MRKDVEEKKSTERLYELSLAAGTSLDALENCRHFLEALARLQGLTSASVWRYEFEAYSNCLPFYRYPHLPANIKALPPEHFIFKQLTDSAFFSTKANDKRVADLLPPNMQKKGVVAVFKLGKTGLLELYDQQRREVFSKAELEPLQAVVEKFNLSLAGCLAHEQLMEETENRRIIQKALHKVNRRYSDLFDNLYDAIIVLDRHGNVLESNKAAKKLLGLSLDVEPKVNVRDHIHPEDQRKASHFFKKLLKDGYFSGYEGKILTLDGSIRHVQVNSNAIFKNGKFDGSREIVLDVTEQRQVESRIKDSEEKYRGIIENMELGLLEVDLNQTIVRAYKAFCEMTGYEATELIGKNAWELFLPPVEAGLAGRPDVAHTHFGLGIFETQVRRKDGSLIWVLVSSAPIKDSNGKITGSIGIHYDITNRKKLEHDLAVARIAAEQARLSERQFLANMSHEIRTPMNAVIGMTHLLYETNPTQTQKVYLDSLRFAADSLMGIIDNVLDLSKIEAGELEFEQKSFNLQHLMKSLQRAFQFKVRDKAISVSMSTDPAIEYNIIGDPTRLNQVLTNLLGNASKFTERGSIDFSSNLLRDEGGEYLIEFRVKDTGIGIPEDKLEDIFQNFKQANVNIARKYGGSGLGLTIVKQLVEMQGGSIGVESRLGQGAVFRFTLPFKKSDVKASEQPQEYRMGQTTSRRFLKTLSILVVEDNLMNQKLISKILDIWNCNYQMANHGLEALALSREEAFDLILMDIHMPEMDGCEATEKIRKDPTNPNRRVPIIALTAAALLDEKKRAVKAGMSDFLTKPFSPEMLEACILQHLHFSKTATEEPPAVVENNTQEKLLVGLDYLMEFSNNDSLFVIDMVDTFIKDAPVNAGRLEQALAQDDWQQVYKIVHTLKPNFMMLGMKAQHEKAIEIENLIKSGQFDSTETGPMVSWLAACARQVCPLLEEMKLRV